MHSCKAKCRVTVLVCRRDAQAWGQAWNAKPLSSPGNPEESMQLSLLGKRVLAVAASFDTLTPHAGC